MERSKRLTDILLEPVSNLMGLTRQEGQKLDASARRSEAKALLTTTRRLPATWYHDGQANGTLIEALRATIRLDMALPGSSLRRAVRATEAYSELALPAA